MENRGHNTGGDTRAPEGNSGGDEGDLEGSMRKGVRDHKQKGERRTSTGRGDQRSGGWSDMKLTEKAQGFTENLSMT